jgi:peptidoglycan/xylan/chitin deacetylase (PgdA/CDA1 family)
VPEPTSPAGPRPTRRTLLLAGAAGLAGAGLAACSSGSAGSATGTATGAGTGSAAGTPGASATALRVPAGVAAASSPAAGSSAAPTPTGSPAAGPDITHGPRTRQAVALTFHGAGDPAIVRSMFADFRAAGAHVTVLAIGEWLAANPSLAAMIRDAGHDLGNHTWSHQTMPRLSAATVRTEVDRAAAELQKLTGSIGRWFRPSGTPSSNAAIRQAAVEAGYGACLAYDVDPMDYADPGPDTVVRRFTAAVRPGSIVSLHLGHPGTLQAMPRLLDVLRSKGLSAVTVTNLLEGA